MTGPRLDPAILALAVTASAFAVTGGVGLAGLVRLLRRGRGRTLHAMTLACGLVASGTLVLLALGIDPGAGLVAGLGAGLGGGGC